ncbi:MAG: molybdopterin-dependent oxidoreductase [Burkholderiales bacterium]|nr:molybdopterin-dependent oxidoreductase [Burkholderiales bacterium]
MNAETRCAIRLNVNGVSRDMEVAPWRTLLDVLVEDFRLAKTKEGCSIGECGACTVSMDGKLVCSCLVQAVEAHGRNVVTMEKLTGGETGFSPMREAFIHPDQGARRARAGEATHSPGTKDSKAVFTFCHLCAGHCSMKAIVEDGRVVDLEPDMESGLYAEQCALNKGRFTIPEVLVHKDRLLYPQKRVGARGEGRWQRIGWDEALDTIATKFNECKTKFGPESVAFGLGEPKGMEFAFAQRLASAFGTPSVVTPAWYCGTAKAMAGAFTYGTRVVCDDERLPEVLVLWGANINHTTGGFRRESLERLLDSGGKLIVVDPQKTDTARLADLWIRLRPGSDGALAAGVLKVVVEEGLYERDTVEHWTVGFERLKEHVSTFTLDEVEAASWVPREQIVAFARMYGTARPAAMQSGNAPDQLANSFQTTRVLSILRAICGHINVPGGDVTLTRSAYTRPGSFFLLSKYPRQAEKLLGERFKLTQRSALVPSHALIRAILEEDPYPVKAAMFILTNPLVSWPDSKRTFEALNKLEFTVVSELFMTPTAALADMVLPAAWCMEHEELGYWPGWYEEIRAHPKLVDAPGECWADTKIINELAKRLGLGADFWEDDDEALDLMLKPSGMSYRQFKEKRTLRPTRAYRRHEYGTPSGKIEIWSERLARMGYAPMPVWEELRGASGMSEDYPLLLTNAKEEAYMLCGFKGVASLRTIRPEPIVEMHPDAACKFGLDEGSWVAIETAQGRARQRLSLNRSLDPRVVVATFGWWYPESAESAYGWEDGNINMVTAYGPEFDPSTGGITLRGVPCRVRKV